MIKPNLFISLINLYEIKPNDYQKCYEEIKAEIKEMNLENDIHDNKIEKEINNHLPELKGHERNESTKKTMKIGKSVYVPSKLKSSNVLIKVNVTDNLISNNRYNENSPNKFKEDSNDEDSKEKENQKEGSEITLSLNEIDSKNKKYKIKSQKNNIATQNPAGHLSIDCNTNIFRSNQNLPRINLKSRERYSVMTLNNEETSDSTHSKNFSQSKQKIKPILKELAHVRKNQERYHSLNSKDSYANSSVATSVEKDKEQEIERPNIKKKSKFFTASIKNVESNNLDDKLPRNNIRTSTKLPMISGFDSLHYERLDTNIGEQNRNNHEHNHNHNHHKTKKHYKLKTHIYNAEIKDNMPDEGVKDAKNIKKLIEVL
jgi:hypothetical protein